MGNFSKPPQDVLQANLGKGYVGVHIEQGVPVLDRDLNLLHDIVAAALRSLSARYIGDGVAVGGNGYAVEAIPANNNFRVQVGSALVGGIEVTNPAVLTYSAQPGLPALTTPSAARTDTVFLDVSLTEVDGTVDTELLNAGDVGLQTSVRLKAVSVVRVAENATALPAPAPGHTHFLLARLTRQAGVAAIQAAMITDLRQTRLTVADMERRMRVLEQLAAPSFNDSPNQFSPKTGVAGANVTLFGSRFNVASGLAVRFGSVAAVIVGSPTGTQVVVRVPAMPAGAVTISAETSFGTATTTDTFNVLP